MSKGKPSKRFLFGGILGVWVVAIQLLSMIFLPILSEKAAAAPPPTNVNILERSYSDSVTPNYGTCTGYFTTALKDDALLSREFYSDMGGLPYHEDVQKLREEYTKQLGRDIVSYIGTFHGKGSEANATVEEIVYILRNKGTMNIPVIKFKPSTPPASGIKPDGTPYSGNTAACDKMMMIPINNKTWRGFQGINPGASAGSDGRYRYAEFTMESENDGAAVGKMDLWTRANNRTGQYHNQPVTIEGLPDGSNGGGTGGTGTVYGSWSDAATITLPNTTGNGRFGGEIYKKYKWNTNVVNGTAYSIYFLDKPGPNDTGGTRAAMTFSGGRGCENPLPVGSACNGGQGNCVPFIAVKQQLNVSHSDTNLGGLQRNINQLGNANATLYDYDPANCRQNTTMQVDWTSSENAKVWLYYSHSEDAFRAVFVSGDPNEQVYIANYSKASNGVYKGGANGCDGIVYASQIPGQGPGGINSGFDTFGVNWELYSNNCSSPRLYGKLTVMALGGSAGEGNFHGINDAANQAPSGSSEEPKLGCEILSLNPLNWLVCPIVNVALFTTAKLDDAINSMLTVDVKDIFSSNASNAYHTAWGSFRFFALALVVIAALIMVIAQAAGLEILDAYTFRKMVPRIGVVVVFIPLSWEFLEWATTLSNDLGNGVRALIYAPFNASGLTANPAQLGGGSNFVLALLGTGAALAFGWVGLLSFVLTGLLAAAIAFVILIFRKMLIIFLIMVAPFAIACYILPNTQKFWNFWKDTLFAALIVFAIISAFIAIGRVFSVTSFYAPGNQTVNQLVAIVAYFAPYFLITTAFRLAGGFIATVGGFVNDRSRGAFDRLKNFRGNRVNQNTAAMRAGSRFSDRNALTRGFNQASSGIGLGWQGRFGLGGRGNEARHQNIHNSAMRMMQSDAFKANMEDDDFLHAATYGSANEATAGLTARFQQEGMDQQAAMARAQRAANAVQASGLQFSRPLAYAAAQGLVNTGTGYSNLEDMAQTLGRAAGGNASTATSLAGFSNFMAKNKGRHDLAPGFGNLNNLVRREGGIEGTPPTARDYQGMGGAMDQAWASGDPVTLIRDRAPAFQNFLSHFEGQYQDAQRAYQQSAAVGDDAGMQQAVAQAQRAETALYEMQQSQMYATGDNAGRLSQTLSRLESPDGARSWLSGITDPAAGPVVRIQRRGDDPNRFERIEEAPTLANIARSRARIAPSRDINREDMFG